MEGKSRPRRSDFEALFENHELAFRVYAKVLLPSWDAVDDVMQAASLVMWKKMEELDSSEGFLPWGKVIVRFTALKHLRSQTRDPLVFDQDLIDLLAAEAESGDEEDLARRQDALAQCLDALGSASRKLVLSPYQGHGYLSRIAEASGRTCNSIYKQIRRIRGKLEQCVRQQLESST